MKKFIYSTMVAIGIANAFLFCWIGMTISITQILPLSMSDALGISFLALLFGVLLGFGLIFIG